jgi:hypothetical protein
LLRAALTHSQANACGGKELLAIQNEPAFVGTLNLRKEFRELLTLAGEPV